MENRETPKSEIGFDIYTKPLVPYLSENHLDIGCGRGEITFYLSSFKTNIKTTGFDPNQESIEIAKKVFGNRHHLSFTSNKEDLNNKKFDSSSAVFVYHEAGKDIFETAFNALNKGSFFTVVDYDLKNIGLNRFHQVFNSIDELKEVEKLGWNEACFIHTNRGLQDCEDTAKNFGFKTVETKKLNDKYFLWVGQKI